MNPTVLTSIALFDNIFATLTDEEQTKISLIHFVGNSVIEYEKDGRKYTITVEVK